MRWFSLPSGRLLWQGPLFESERVHGLSVSCCDSAAAQVAQAEMGRAAQAAAGWVARAG